MERACRISGLILIWVSVPAITVGAYFQSSSPQFTEYQQQEIARQATSSDGKELLNPVGRMTLALSFTWQFACCFSSFFAVLYTSGVLSIRVVGRRHRNLSLMMAGVFGLGCLVGAASGVDEALRNFRWGFAVLGYGYLLSAAGLAVGAAGVSLQATSITAADRGVVD